MRKNAHTHTTHTYSHDTKSLFRLHSDYLFIILSLCAVGSLNLAPTTHSRFNPFYTRSSALQFLLFSVGIKCVCMHKYKQTIIRSRMHRHECVSFEILCASADAWMLLLLLLPCQAASHSHTIGYLNGNSVIKYTFNYKIQQSCQSSGYMFLCLISTFHAHSSSVIPFHSYEDKFRCGAKVMYTYLLMYKVISR